MKTIRITILLLASLVAISCEKDIRNIGVEPAEPTIELPPSPVVPVNVNQQGFDLLENMKGHWVGKNRVIADDWPWFAFDYRPISPSHIFGIFEGGSMGNLFTSFFVTDFDNTRTIMARNGGVLSGIYRTSYFVLDSVSYEGDDSFYRLVDAVGGTNIMWMELRFTGDSLYFNSYTSRLGLTFPPARHMTFRAKRNDREQADLAGENLGFPENTPEWDFSNGFKWLYAEPGEEPKSATYLFEGQLSIENLALLSGDPFTISDHQHLARLELNIEQNQLIQGKRIMVFLSKEPLTDVSGFLLQDPSAWNSVQLFPDLSLSEKKFDITYLHPGDYFVTLVADLDNNFIAGPGDITHPLQSITISPEGDHQLTISNINVQN